MVAKIDIDRLYNIRCGFDTFRTKKAKQALSNTISNILQAAFVENRNILKTSTNSESIKSTFNILYK